MDNRLSPMPSYCSHSRCTSPTRCASPSGYCRRHKEDDHICREFTSLYYTDLLPFDLEGGPETRDFVRRVNEIALDHVEQTFDRKCKILHFHQPEQLKEVLDLKLPEEPLSLEQLLSDCRNALKYQVKTGQARSIKLKDYLYGAKATRKGSSWPMDKEVHTAQCTNKNIVHGLLCAVGHPRFMNQLSCGLEVVSLVGEYVTAAANTNMFTYEIAPVFILMEQIVMRKMREIIGYKNGDSILAPGGSISNLYAAMCARHKMFPQYKEKGLAAIPGELVMFTSTHSHYSLKGAAATMGLGTDNLILVPVDNKYRMNPAELDRLIKEEKDKGKIPFFVCATAGTTVMGAFDPINEIADICEKHKLWFHVDAAWGGGVLLSRKTKHKMAGVERSDSITWNPHKLMGVTLQCSTVHFKEDGLLFSCNQMCADYLFQQDKPYDVNYDTGDKVIQCGRHNDIFKLWLLWRSKGDEGFERHIDHLFEISGYLVEQLKAHSDKFELMHDEPECTNVCFWYVPYRLRTMKAGPERHKILGEIQPILKGRMMTAGSFMIGYQPLDDYPNFFRNIISSQAVSKEDIDYMMEELDRLGYDL